VDLEELNERQRAAHEDADSVKRAVPRIALLNEPLRHYERDGSRPTERAGELGEDRQGGLESNPLQSPDAKRSQRPIVR
jgi:hypothetical protein